MLFPIPGLPDDALCFAGGLTSIPMRRLVLVAVVGRAPGFLLVNILGDLLASGDLFAAGLLAAVLVAQSLLGYRNRNRILRRFRRR